MSSAPPGAQLSPEELAQDQSETLLAIFIVFTVLPTIAVGLRLAARWQTKAKLWWDDYLSVIALALCWTQFAFLQEALRYGLGRHAAALPPTFISPYLMVRPPKSLPLLPWRTKIADRSFTVHLHIRAGIRVGRKPHQDQYSFAVSAPL